MKVKQSLAVFAVCVLLSVLFIYPQMRFSQPNLLDIAETWSLGTDVFGNTIDTFSNPSRFLFVGTFVRSSLNAIFLYRTPYYFLFFSVLLGCSLFLLITAARYKAHSWYVYALVSMIILVSPITVDTYWRLGAAENYFALALLLSIYFSIRSRYNWAIFSLVMLMLSKETAIFYIPIFLVWFYLKKKYGFCTMLGVGYVWFVFKIYNLIVFAQQTVGQYTSLFSATPESIRDMFVYYVTANIFYVMVFVVALGLFLYRTWNKRIQTEEWGHFFIALIGAGIASLLFFHNKFQPYYMFPLMLTIVLFFVYELMLVHTKTRFAVIAYTLVLFVGLRVPQLAWARANYWQDDYVADGALISQIQQTLDSRVYIFARLYRPELQSALDVLYTQHPHAQSAKQYGIYAVDEAKNIIGAEVPCGKTMIGAPACKWAVIPIN